MPEEMTEAAEEKNENNVLDDSETDDTVVPTTYQITSFGADYDVEGLVRRLNREEIFVPHFQREYVWTMPDASRLIESLLLGLPVPGIFLAREAGSHKLLVIDGQQRLKSLQFFCDGFFGSDSNQGTRRVFKLTKVQPQYEGKTYAMLSDAERRQLDGSIIHATIVKQETPTDGDTSIYHIFERLNTGGRKLMPQEIRVASYHGPLLDLLDKLNNNPAWRSIYGKKSNRLKDEELILRFLAMRFERENYARPMVEFLSKFASKHRRTNSETLMTFQIAFTEAIEFAFDALGAEAFRTGRQLNAAIFDSIMVGLSESLQCDTPVSKDLFTERYQWLIADPDYLQTTSRSTANEASVKLRMSKALEAISNR